MRMTISIISFERTSPCGQSETEPEQHIDHLASGAGEDGVVGEEIDITRLEIDCRAQTRKTETQNEQARDDDVSKRNEICWLIGSNVLECNARETY